MLLSLATAAVALAAAFATDTTITVGPGTRLSLRNHGGSIQVTAWDREAVRVRAEHGRRDRVRIGRRGGVLSIASVAERRAPGRVDYRLTVPRGMPVSLNGTNASAVVRGLKGDLSVLTVNGEIAVQGGSGAVSLTSVQGPITVRGARGRLQVNSVNGEIRMLEVAGSIQAETVNGPIELSRVVSDYVNASTVNGSLCYDGTIADGGHYRFASHNGDIAVGLPAGVDAMVRLATYGGRIRSDFPIKLDKGKLGKLYRLQLGKGKADLELESFQGSLRLLKPGAIWVAGEAPCEDDVDEDEDKEEE